MNRRLLFLFGVLVIKFQFALAYMPDTLWSVDITNCSNKAILIGGTVPTTQGTFAGKCWHIPDKYNDFFNIQALQTRQSMRFYTLEIGDDAGWYNDCNNNNEITKSMYTYIGGDIIEFSSAYHNQTKKSDDIPVLPNKRIIRRMAGQKTKAEWDQIEADEKIRVALIDRVVYTDIKTKDKPLNIHLYYYSESKPIKSVVDQTNSLPSLNDATAAYQYYKCFE